MHEYDMLTERFRRFGDRPALVWRDEEYSYAWLIDRIEKTEERLKDEGIGRCVVSLEAEYSPYATAALFALFGRSCVVLPIDGGLVAAKVDEYLDVGEAQARIEAGEDGPYVRRREGAEVRHPLLLGLLRQRLPGLVLFSSGSTGKSKAAVHRADRLLSKYRAEGRAARTIPFMMFDHIGGMNTLLTTLANGGCLHVLKDRSPEEVCRTIERYRIEALPVSPTFMNLLLLSRAHRDYDLSSLKVVSYGSEVMPPHTLAAWNAAFPDVRTVQAYGMSELGVLKTKSKRSDSLLFALQGEDAACRIVDGLLEIKAESAMIGYLNAPDPFTPDGWLRTGDEAVEEEGYIRILGRRSEIINVGGKKVYPAEVESVLQQLAGIEEVVVSAGTSGITGQLVMATVKLQDGTEPSLGELRKRIWAHCRDKLPAYKIPQKVVIARESLMSGRLKKIRKPQQNEGSHGIPNGRREAESR